MPGYLSLHQMTNSLTVKWTPNQLMNSGDLIDKTSNYWGYALNINVDEIVYVHCHQSSGTDGTGGTIVFVGQDGVQRSPIHFPEGGSMGAFLSCLETGLLPHGVIRLNSRCISVPLANPIPTILIATGSAAVVAAWNGQNREQVQEAAAALTARGIWRRHPH